MVVVKLAGQSDRQKKHKREREREREREHTRADGSKSGRREGE